MLTWLGGIVSIMLFLLLYRLYCHKNVMVWLDSRPCHMLAGLLFVPCRLYSFEYAMVWLASIPCHMPTGLLFGPCMLYCFEYAMIWLASIPCHICLSSCCLSSVGYIAFNMQWYDLCQYHAICRPGLSRHAHFNHHLVRFVVLLPRSVHIHSFRPPFDQIR